MRKSKHIAFDNVIVWSTLTPPKEKTKKKKIKMAQVEHSNTHHNPKKACSSQLNREDFDGGPVSFDQIEKGLFLGWTFLLPILNQVYNTKTFTGNVTAATDKESLQTHNITHILTVDSCPLPSHVLQISYLTNKYIQGEYND